MTTGTTWTIRSEDGEWLVLDPDGYPMEVVATRREAVGYLAYYVTYDEASDDDPWTADEVAELARQEAVAEYDAEMAEAARDEEREGLLVRIVDRLDGMSLEDVRRLVEHMGA